eukprot:TRINITY_DN11542_c0_g1_i1.p1 TRINITY_DN11542_c0_g1~~TRINITY_DN11542_c0_g1_i1.p1  ORF type:complete len:2102 (-),score=595.45 TRINITY_DN11542_c0_g1_i1:50-6355(-)
MQSVQLRAITRSSHERLRYFLGDANRGRSLGEASGLEIREEHVSDSSGEEVDFAVPVLRRRRRSEQTPPIADPQLQASDVAAAPSSPVLTTTSTAAFVHHQSEQVSDSEDELPARRRRTNTRVIEAESQSSIEQAERIAPPSPVLQLHETPVQPSSTTAHSAIRIAVSAEDDDELSALSSSYDSADDDKPLLPPKPARAPPPRNGVQPADASDDDDTPRKRKRHKSVRHDGNPFTREQVTKWSKARRQSWAIRHSNPNAYYYRFTDPNCVQRMGDWTAHEHQQFMERVEEFRVNAWHIGNSWGIFSLALPHRVGYQCSNYYRKLLQENVLSDPTYAYDEKGQFRQLNATRSDIEATCVAESEHRLTEVWQSEEVQEIEENVNAWIQEAFPGTDTGKSFHEVYKHKRVVRRAPRAHSKKHTKKSREKHSGSEVADTTESESDNDGHAHSGSDASDAAEADAMEVDSARPAAAPSLLELSPAPSRVMTTRATVVQPSPSSVRHSATQDSGGDVLILSPLRSTLVPRAPRETPPPLPVSVAFAVPDDTIVLDDEDADISPQIARRGTRRRALSPLRDRDDFQMDRGLSGGGRGNANPRRHSSPAPPLRSRAADDILSSPLSPLDGVGAAPLVRRELSPFASPRPIRRRPTLLRSPLARRIQARAEDGGVVDSSDDDDFVGVSPRRMVAGNKRRPRLALNAPALDLPVEPSPAPELQPVEPLRNVATATSKRFPRETPTLNPPAASIPPLMMAPLELCARSSYYEVFGSVVATADFVPFVDCSDGSDALVLLVGNLFADLQDRFNRVHRYELDGDRQSVTRNVDECTAFFRFFDTLLQKRVAKLSDMRLLQFKLKLFAELQMILPGICPLSPLWNNVQQLSALFKLHVTFRWSMLGWLEQLDMLPSCADLADDAAMDLLQMFSLRSQLTVLLHELVRLFSDYPVLLQPAVDRPVALLWIRLIHTCDAAVARAAQQLDGDAKQQPFWSLFNETVLALKTIPGWSETRTQTEVELSEFVWDLMFHVAPLSWYDMDGSAHGSRPLNENWSLVQTLLAKSPLASDFSGDLPGTTMLSNLFPGQQRLVDHWTNDSQMKSYRSALLRRCLTLSAVWSPNFDIVAWLWAELQRREPPKAVRAVEFPEWLTNFNGKIPDKADRNDSETVLVLKVLCVQLNKHLAKLSVDPRPEDTQAMLTLQRATAVNRVSLRFFKTFPDAPTVTATGAPSPSAPTSTTISQFALRDHLAMLLTLHTFLGESQMSAVLRRLTRSMNFERSDYVARAAMIQALGIFCAMLPLSSDVSDVLQRISGYLTSLCAEFLQAEQARTNPVQLASLFLTSAQRASMSEAAQQQQQQQEQQRANDLSDLIDTALSSLTHVLKHRGAHNGEHIVIDATIGSLLSAQKPWRASLRLRALGLISAALVGAEPATPAAPTPNATPTPVPVPQPPAAPAVADEFDDVMLDDAFIERMMSQYENQKREDDMRRERPLALVMQQQIYHPLSTLLNSRFPREAERLERQRPRIDHDVFVTVIKCMAELARLLIRHRHRTWEQYLQDFGPNSLLIRLSSQQEQRQVPLRFFVRLLQLEPTILPVQFEPLVVNLWMLSMLEYQRGIQNVFTAQLINMPRLAHLFEGMNATDVSITNEQIFWTNRLRCLTIVLRNIGNHWSNARQAGGAQLGQIKTQLSSYFLHMSVVLHQSQKELRGRPLADEHIKFCYAALGQMFTYCSEVLYDHNPHSPFPQLLSDFFATGDSVHAVGTLPVLLRGFAKLDVLNDSFLLRKLSAIFQDFFESITNNPLKSSVEAARMAAFVRGLSRSGPDAERVVVLRRLVLAEHMRTYMLSPFTNSITCSGLAVSAFTLLERLAKQCQTVKDLQDDVVHVVSPLLDCVSHATIQYHAMVRGCIYRYTQKVFTQVRDLDPFGQFCDDHVVTRSPRGAAMKTLVELAVQQSVCGMFEMIHASSASASLPAVVQLQRQLPTKAMWEQARSTVRGLNLDIVRCPMLHSAGQIVRGGTEFYVDRDPADVMHFVISNMFELLYAVFASSVTGRLCVLKYLPLMNAIVMSPHNGRQRMVGELQELLERLGEAGQPYLQASLEPPLAGECTASFLF